MIKEAIESKAEEVLKKYGESPIPIQIEEIALRMNLKVSRAPSEEFSGLLIRKDGHALIGINSNEAGVRQRFTIAHEIAHFVLHPAKDAFVDYRNKKGSARTSDERDADAFAAALLMPRIQLERDFSILSKIGFSGEEISYLAKKYDVSEDAMKFRLKNLTLMA
jgi:Zn-dependent peptidase ImmA (M78 family)